MVWEKIATFAFVGYIGWMLARGKTYWRCRLDHPDRLTFPPNARPVYREDEPGTYWGVMAFHGVLLIAMVYVAFFK